MKQKIEKITKLPTTEHTIGTISIDILDEPGSIYIIVDKLNEIITEINKR
jgi:hypothetical protein